MKYVIDTGRYKERVYSEATGIQKFEIKWISQAAADQRAGRAGRTGPGKCFRLFSVGIDIFQGELISLEIGLN